MKANLSRLGEIFQDIRPRLNRLTTLATLQEALRDTGERKHEENEKTMKDERKGNKRERKLTREHGRWGRTGRS